MSKKTLRHNQLIQIIKQHGMLPVKVLAGMLEVSEMTVRRDLEYLDGQGQATADAAPGEWDKGEYSLLGALEKSNEQKEAIGRRAASLIENNDVIIIDTGSTTARMLPYIPTDMNLTILCYNANVLYDLRYRPGIKLLFCGGEYHQNTEMFESPEGIHFIERTRANKVFLSAAGVHRELGVTCANSYEVPTKHAVIRSSSQRILLVDSSKFGQLRSAYFCGFSDISAIITDSDINDDWRVFLQSQDIALWTS